MADVGLEVEVLVDAGDRLVLRLSGSRLKGANDAVYLYERLEALPFQRSRWSVRKQGRAAEETYEVVDSMARGPRCSCPNFPFRRRNIALPNVCRHVEALRAVGQIAREENADGGRGRAEDDAGPPPGERGGGGRGTGAPPGAGAVADVPAAGGGLRAAGGGADPAGLGGGPEPGGGDSAADRPGATDGALRAARPGSRP